MKAAQAIMLILTAGKMKNSKSGGYTYLMLLVVVASMALMASVLGAIIFSRETRIEKENELIFRGMAYAEAIKSYHDTSGSNGAFPMDLEDLVKDPRFPLKKHIRRLYKDPITGKDWILITAPGGGIVGVTSSSKTKPIKQTNFPVKLRKLESAEHYSDWLFVYDM